MKTPGGWALAGMLYDKYPGVPPRGSPLESVMLLVFLERQRTQLRATRAMVQATLPADKEAQDPAVRAFRDYSDAMFPFLDRAQDTERENARKELLEFVRRPAVIDRRPVLRAKMQKNQAKRFKVRPKLPGTPYRREK